MPKIPHSPIRMYFLLQPPGSNGNNTAESECKACGLRMKGNHASNMERHVRRSHPEIYEKYLELKQKTFESINATGSFDAQAFEQLDVNFDPANFIKIKKIKQDLKQMPSTKRSQSQQSHMSIANKLQIQQNVLNACVELVTTNGRPFNMINDSGFRKLVDLACTRMSPTLGIDETTVKQLVVEKAAKLKSSFVERVQGIVVNVKVDIGTTCNRSFMNISIYFYSEGKVVSHTIAFNEINVRYETSELENLILKELNRFGVTKEQIYSIVIDSGSNVKMVAGSSTTESASSAETSFDVANIQTEDTGDAILNVGCAANLKLGDTISVTEDGEASVRVITVFSENEDEDNDLDWCTTEIIIGKLNFETPVEESSLNLTVMKCIGDVLQMAIYEALKSNDEICEVLKEARSLHQKLIALNERKIISLDLEPSVSLVRWKTVVTMLEKVIAAKSGCIRLGLISEEDNFWSQLKNLLDSLQPCAAASEVLQRQQLVFGDVYKVWFNCILETSKIDCSYAKIFSDSMRQKQAEILNNSTFLAALFLDPRFNNMILTSEQKKTAIAHLVACHQKFMPDQEKDLPNMETSEEVDELERIFQMQENCKEEENARESKLAKLEIILKNFCESEPRLKTTENIIHFWEMKKAQYPDIYNLAGIIFSVPATQQSFFKLVSQVQYATSASTTNISEDLFNDVMILRSNPES